MDVINLNVSPETVLLLTFFGIGVAELIHRTFKKDYESVAKIVACTIVCGLLALGVPGVTVLTGAAIGLNASGILTALSFIGKKTSDAPSSLAV